MGRPFGCVFKFKFNHTVLKKRKTGHRVENLTPCVYVFCTVTLHTGTPHSRSFGAVKHAELHGSAVSNNAHLSAHGIYLPDNLPFGYTANCRITRHLTDTVHIFGNQQGRRPETCGGNRSLASGVTATYNYDIKFKFHKSPKPCFPTLPLSPALRVPCR